MDFGHSYSFFFFNVFVVTARFIISPVGSDQNSRHLQSEAESAAGFNP